jgi:hypothetical protein
MKVEILFPGEVDWTDVSSLVRDSFSLTRRAASNDFHAATDLFNCTLLYDLTIYGKLRSMTTRANIRYYDDSNVIKFYGYFMPLTSYSYDGQLDTQMCDIEAQDYMELLRTPVGTAEDDDVAYEDYKILDNSDPTHSVVHALFTKIGLSTDLIATGITISGTSTGVGAVTSSSYEEDAFTILDTLLYEYGYVCNWNEEGKFSPIKWIIPSGTAYAYAFTDNNIIESIDESVTPYEYEGNQVVWYGLEDKTGVRLYTEDLPYDDDGEFSGYAVLAGFYYPPEASVIDSTTGDYQKVYQEYNDTGIRYKTAGRYVEEEYVRDFALAHADFSEILITKNHAVSDRKDDGLLRDLETFKNKRARIRYSNPNVTSRLLYYMHIDGDIVYKKTQQKTKIQTTSGALKLDSYESRFIFDITSADALCAAQYQAKVNGSRTYKFQSSSDVAEGAYVLISLDNGVTAGGIVMEKVYDGLTKIYSYEVAAFTATYRTPTAREVIQSQRSPITSTSQLEDMPSYPSLAIVGDTIVVPSGSITLTAYVDGATASTYQWYYTTVSGVDTAIAGQTSSAITIAYDASYLLPTDTRIICRINNLWSVATTASKWTYDPDIAYTTAAQALQSAATAQATADGKIYSFFTASAPTASGIGDIWFETDAGNKPWRWDGSQWVDAQDDSIAAALAVATTASGIADGKSTVYYQASKPAGEIGDIWIDTDDNKKMYTHDGNDYVLTQDSYAAQTTANAATKTWIQTSAPTIGSRPNAIAGDTWIDSDDSNKVYRAIGTSWVLQSYTIPLDHAAYWSGDETPDIPDYAAGITYLQDAWATTDSWGGNSTPCTVADGILTCKPNGVARLGLASAGKTVRIKIKSATAQTISIYFDGGGGTFISQSIGTDWVIVNGVIPAGAAGYIIVGAGTSYDFYIDWIYIGTAQYTTPLIDNSGNGKHATIYGATPVEGVSGKALSFDGVNDYTSQALSFPTGAFTFSFWIKTSTDSKHMAAKYGAAGNRQFIMAVGALTTAHKLNIWLYADGTTAISFVSATSIDDGTWKHCAIVYTPSTSVDFYINGVLDVSRTTSVPASLFNSTANFTLGFGTTYFNGYWDETVLFSRALSAAEVLGLYNAKALPSKYSLAKYQFEQGYAPKYLDATTTAPTVTPHKDDWYTKTAATYGIYVFDGYAWARASTPSTAQIAAAFPDICVAVNASAGDMDDYVGDGVNYAEVLAANTAFFNKLFAQFIKIQTGGSIRGGDRYDEDGAIADGTVPGFWIGASGSCKVAGLEFEGSQGGGVQWGAPAQLGTVLNIPSMFRASLANLNGNDIAYIDYSLDKLRTYRWSGSTWSMVGSELSVSTVGNPSICSLNTTDIAFFDNSNDELRLYRWSGSSWSMVGSGLSITPAGTAAMAALNSTDIAFIDATNLDLRLYRWGGSSWSLVGSELNISAAGILSMTALNGTDIAYYDNSINELRTYRWGGSSWSLVGTGLSIPTAGVAAMAALNGTDIAYINSISDSLVIYRWDGSTWAQVGSAGNTGVIDGRFSAMAALNGTDIAFIEDNSANLRVYRFGFALSNPWRYPFTS